MCSDDYHSRIFFYYCLIIFVIGLWFFTAIICYSAPPDEVAVDLTVATMVDGVTPIPKPFNCSICKDTGWIMHGDGHQTKCLNCNLAKLSAGPFDIIKQAKELIRRGNELAKRGKALLDAFEKDGKITVDVRLPSIDSTTVVKLKPTITSGCADGSCRVKRTYTKPKSRWRWK